MKSFQRILCVVDPLAKHQFALQQAIELAVNSQGSLKLVDVVDTTVSWLDLLKSHSKIFEQERRSRLEALAAKIRGKLPNFETETLRGRLALQVVKQVESEGFDVVVKDARGTSSHKTLLIGSIDMRLVRNCPCPVWLAMPAQEHQTQRILAAVDPLASEEDKTVNRRILQLAFALARSRGEFHVVSAWDMPGEELLAGHMPHDRFLEFVGNTQQLAQQNLDDMLRPYRDDLASGTVHLQKGESSAVILDTLSEINATLLVIGSVGRSLPNLLIGNTADTVLRQIECSVLTVKPRVAFTGQS